jgi:hypothetical protein
MQLSVSKFCGCQVYKGISRRQVHASHGWHSPLTSGYKLLWTRKHGQQYISSHFVRRTSVGLVSSRSTPATPRRSTAVRNLSPIWSSPICYIIYSQITFNDRHHLAVRTICNGVSDNRVSSKSTSLTLFLFKTQTLLL